MPSLIIGLVVLVCLLAIITVVGHGIWIMFAGLFGSAPPPETHAATRRRRICPDCESALLATERDCFRCGLDQDSRLARQLERLRFSAREVQGLAERGELEADAARTVAERLLARLRALRGQPVLPVAMPLRSARPPESPVAPEPVPILEALPIDEPRPVLELPPVLPPGAVPAATPVADRPRPGLLAGFMEEKNILWGELVGGLLIVGCSIALVLTLWKSLEALPYFPFLLSTAITMALFGAGQYTLHHWKLTATSRGLLVISLLLAPLNLLLLATPGSESFGEWFDAGVQFAAAVAFVGMVRAAGRDLIGTDLLPGPVDRRWLLALAVVGAPLSQAVPASWLGAERGLVLAWLPLACQALACAAVLGGLGWSRRRSEAEPLSELTAIAVLTFVGLSAFALFAAWGLLLTRTDDLAATLRVLSLPLVIGSVTVLEAGLLVQRRIRVELSGLRATGTGVALAGSALLLSGITLAWPDPLWQMGVAAVAGAVFARIAWRDALPGLNAGAVPALALACVLAVLGVTGQWPSATEPEVGARLLRALGTSTSGIALAAFALALASVAELAVRIGNRAQGVGYAFGGIAVGAASLFLVSVRGVEEPWPAVGVHLACAVGLLAANVRWKRLAAAQAGVWLLLAGSVWFLWAVRPERSDTWGFAVALEAMVLATAALGVTRRAARFGAAGVVFAQLRSAGRDVALAAGALAAAFAVFAHGFPEGSLHSATFLTLAPAALLLARVFPARGLTWVGSTSLYIGLIHLGTFTEDLRPVSASLMLASLSHATVAASVALLFWKRRSYARLFAEPLRGSAWLSSAFAVPLLFFPSAGLAHFWAGFAVWLAVLWFGMVWVRGERVGFSAAQCALAAAAVLLGLTWVERQEWWATTSMGASDPRALQVFGIALAVLGLVTVLARRVAGGSERLRDLWLNNSFSADRLILGGVIAMQLGLLVHAVELPVRQELNPAGLMLASRAPPELIHAFGGVGWLLAALLGTVLLASLRLRTDGEPDGGPTLLALALLSLTVPVLAAGAFVPELAAASALRWGLGIAFVLGSTMVAAREPLARLATAMGFSTSKSELTTRWAHALFAIAAAVVVLLAANVAEIGLSGRTPGGPAEGSAFAAMGWTASNVVPMVLVILGLAGTAGRERWPGYAFAAGLAFTFTVVGGYALAVVASGGTLDAVQQLRLGMLTAGSAAVWALLWLAAERRVRGGPLLTIQVLFALSGVGLLAFLPLVLLFASPDVPLHPAFAELGGFGWIVLVLAVWAGFEHAGRTRSTLRAHVIGFAGLAVGVLAACAVQPLDAPGRWVSFHALALTWAAVGLGFAAAMFRAGRLSRGPWLNVVAAGLAVLALRGRSADLGAWVWPLGLAVFALLAAGIAALLERQRDGFSTARRWARLLLSELAVGIVAAFLAIFAALTGSPVERLGGPFAVLLLSVATALLATKSPAVLSGRLRFGTILTAALGIALVGWAVPDPEANAAWLQRNAWAFVALAAVSLVGLEFIPRLSPAFAADARRVGGGLAVAACAGIVIVLLQQVPVYDPVTKRTPLTLPAVLAVLAAVATLIALAFRVAMKPAADPLELPESKRTIYVYLAEVLLVLLFVQVRFSLPELFLGTMVRYWTFLVMLLAFVGIGLAEVCERRGVRVLAIPLRRTGVLLPLIPLLAFWLKPPGALLEFADTQAPGARPFLGYLEKLPQHFDSYAGLWLLAGMLYGILALQRRSFGWALLAALATNAAMWALLVHNDVSAAVHPQVWVIPLALILLVAEHINRRELRHDVSAGLRYLGIGMLYLSSSAEMFIAGIGNSLWLPVVLAALCVGGVLAGILLRVRAFLFLGVGFLLLDLFAMIWHAAVDRQQTWVWYASGIVLGAAILALFAVFEKRKNDVLGVVDRLREWD